MTRARYAPRPSGLPPEQLVDECIALLAEGRKHAATVRLGDQLDTWLRNRRPYVMTVCERLVQLDAPTPLLLTALMMTRTARGKIWSRSALENAARTRLSTELTPTQAEAILRGIL